MLKAPKRNRYFRGKLLDVDHFDLEQVYFNDKRWLINRFGIGSGVLNGLICELFGDGGTVRIQPGVAIDSAGREIILSEPSEPFDPRVLTDVHGKATGSRIEGAGVVQIALFFAQRSVDPMPSFDDACAAADGCSASAWEERCTISVRQLDSADSAAEVSGGGVALAKIQLPEDISAVAIDNSIRRRIESNMELLERILALESGLPKPKCPTITEVSWQHQGELSAKELSENGLEIAFSDPLSDLPSPIGWVHITIEYPLAATANAHVLAEGEPINLSANFPAETIAEQRLLVACDFVGTENTRVSLQVSLNRDESFSRFCAERGCQQSGVLCRVRIKCSALANLDEPNGGESSLGGVPEFVGFAGSDFESWFTLRLPLEIEPS
jgi:hypothetical protein